MGKFGVAEGIFVFETKAEETV